MLIQCMPLNQGCFYVDSMYAIESRLFECCVHAE